MRPHELATERITITDEATRAATSIEDFIRDFNSLRALPPATRRRLEVLVCAIMIEAMCSHLRRLVSSLAQQGVVELEDGERALLSEIAWKVKDSGKPEPVRRRDPSLARVRFSMDIVARIFGVKAENAGKSAQVSLESVFEIRDRIVHPASWKSAEVSEPEAKIVADTMAWFHKQIENLLRAFLALMDSDAVQKRIAAIRGPGDAPQIE